MFNPAQHILQKYMYSMLQEKYQNNVNIISRISHYLVTENDLIEFSKLVGDIYESAYARAMKEYNSQLESAGFKVAIVHNKSNE